MTRSLGIAATDELVWDTIVELIRKSRAYRELTKVEILGKDYKSLKGSEDESKETTQKIKVLKKTYKKIEDALAKVETDRLAVTGLIMGMVPLWAHHMAVEWLKLDSQLTNLNAAKLFQISVLFAVIPPIVQQLWFFHAEKTQDFLMSTAVMIVGDWVGIVFFLYLLKLMLPLLRSSGLLGSNNDSSK